MYDTKTIFFNGQSSQLSNVLSGVATPRECTWALLFLSYINDLLNNLAVNKLYLAIH